MPLSPLPPAPAGLAAVAGVWCLLRAARMDGGRGGRRQRAATVAELAGSRVGATSGRSMAPPPLLPPHAAPSLSSATCSSLWRRQRPGDSTVPGGGGGRGARAEMVGRPCPTGRPSPPAWSLFSAMHSHRDGSEVGGLGGRGGMLPFPRPSSPLLWPLALLRARSDGIPHPPPLTAAAAATPPVPSGRQRRRWIGGAHPHPPCSDARTPTLHPVRSPALQLPWISGAVAAGACSHPHRASHADRLWVRLGRGGTGVGMEHRGGGITTASRDG